MSSLHHPAVHIIFTPFLIDIAVQPKEVNTCIWWKQNEELYSSLDNGFCRCASSMTAI